ncbi:MAG: hypothetical protein K2J77_11825 [Oscillospiraceae bacterium]|nr:hypothetical protein [Oscillospiraceae bacterium]
MAVRKKSRRKLVHGGKSYVWYILAGDRDYWTHYYTNLWETPFLHIISEDKTLILTIPLDVPKPYAISKGRAFRGGKTSGCWEGHFLPFLLPKAITPKIVADIIDWAERGEDALK